MRLLLLSILVPLLAPSHCVQPADVTPSEGAELKYTHVEFQWEPICFADGYELSIVEDDGNTDPFASGPEVASLVVPDLEPRAVVTDGLEFGRDYAWRIRATHDPHRGHGGWRGHGPAADEADTGDWSPAYRFETKPLPDNLPTLTVLEPEAGELEPGLTIADLIAFPFPPSGLLRSLAVDRTGKVVWFNEPIGSSTDARQLPNGRFLHLENDRAYETTLNGEVTWASPDDSDLALHHEVFPMPNGNFMAIAWERRDVELDGSTQSVRGDRIIEFDRETNEIVWFWSTHDHYSLLDSAPGSTPADGNWTHTNAVVYDKTNNTVTISSRNLSRITRIDYATGEIIFNMGRDAPSGDVDFGGGLFLQQHAPQPLPNGNLLLHDNGSSDRPFTRALEIEFDDPNDPTTATIAWEWETPIFSNAIGDADRLPNGNTLVASGLRPAGSVYEVTTEGALIWQLLAEEGFFFFRAERIEELNTRTPIEAFRARVSAAMHQVSCRAGQD